MLSNVETSHKCSDENNVSIIFIYMKYFGTDGIRGKLTNELNDKTLKKIAKAIVLHLKNKEKKILLVGNDSRNTSDYILSVLSSTLLKNGIEIHNIGLCSSPCLAFLTQKYSYPLGLMLSASHNPAEYNGLKFFNSQGEKVSDAFEESFEALMDKKTSLKNNCFSCTKNVEILKQDYLNHLKQHKKFHFSIILDCANGGTIEICKAIFPKHEKINIKPNGKNINLNAGCTHLEMLKKLCIKKQKIGFAFDGDGDRIHAIDKDGTIITGDKILYILSQFFLKENDVCVGTIYTNKGLEICLNSKKITLKRSDVGDKKVYALMSATHSTLGGEDSGHIILKQFANTGDGLLVAITIANLLELSRKSFKDLLFGYKEYYQCRKNLKIENLSTFQLDNENIKNFIQEKEKLGAKIIVRPSGTEPVLRLFVEHEDKDFAEKTLNALSDFINASN